MSAVALRFKYLASGTETTVDFTNWEVKDVDIQTRQDVNLKRLQNGAPVLYYLSSQWKEIVVTLRTQNSDVLDNADTVRQVTDIMSMILFYPDGTVAENFGVKIDPNQRFFYEAGYKDAVKDIKMKFYEAYSGTPAVQVTLLPIGRS